MGLRIDRVTQFYGKRQVLHGVSLAIKRGEIACLLGPSGCGKTTLLRLAAGLEPVCEGRILIGGRIVADGESGVHLPPEARRAGLMFQDYALFPHLTIVDNVAFGLSLDRAAGRRLARAALDRLQLAGYAESYPHVLSGGQQQRCALLRALLPEPQVLLLDEPFSGLDVALRAAVREDTLPMLRDAGIPTLIVTHDPEEAMAMADRLWLMAEGRIVQHGTPAEVYLHPATAFAAGVFGPLNRLSGRVRDGAVATPLGRFDAPGLGEGESAEVLVRPEGLRRDRGSPGDIEATILEAHLVGCSSHLRLAVDGLSEPMKAIIPEVVLPDRGSVLRFSADPRHVFVFAGEPSAVAARPAAACLGGAMLPRSKAFS